jgi:beta-glucanase (GH16 family)
MSRRARDGHRRGAARSRRADRRAMSSRVLVIAAVVGVAGCGQATGGGGSETTAGPSTPPVTIFYDDFAGTAVDPAKWTVFDRLSDQANAEVNCVAPDNVSVKDGLLEIVSKFEDRSCGDTVEPARTLHYTSGQVQQATPPFLYGTVEVRAKAPGGVGAWPVIWMLGFEWQASQPFTANTPEHGQTAGWASEIDIAEFWQNARREVNTTVHYLGPGGLHIHDLPFDATTRFMVYRVQWAPDSIVWSVDAEDGEGFRELYSVSGSEHIPQVPMFLSIHTAIGGTGGGEPDPATFPQTFQVDSVRITQ